MPRVVPFYAVKCHPEPGILKLLIAMGTGFDCASKGELDMMLKMGVHPSRIIFAHPCKRPCDIRYAQENGVQYTTFDTESELYKMAALNPGFKCVLRIRADDPDARVPLGLKYGADVEEGPRLLKTAKSLGLQVRRVLGLSLFLFFPRRQVVSGFFRVGQLQLRVHCAECVCEGGLFGARLYSVRPPVLK